MTRPVPDDENRTKAPKKVQAEPQKPGVEKPRAEGEDDDGYDPYTDFKLGSAPEPLFEPDPWR